MKTLLRQLKLIDFFTTEIEIEKSDFIKRLKENVDEATSGILFSPFEIFSSSKNELKGNVNYDGFKIWRRRKFFDSKMNIAVATGTYKQRENLLIIETEIKGFHWTFIPFYIFGIIIYAGIVTSISLTENQVPFFVFPFLLLHATLMFGIPYFMMRRSIKRMKYELEREFYYMTKK